MEQSYTTRSTDAITVLLKPMDRLIVAEPKTNTRPNVLKSNQWGLYSYLVV